jgi:cyclic dehypoxanthinyl futalosine synthase
MTAMRIVAAPYLNSRPLTFGLDVVHAAPSECARRLAEGEADVALVPLASVARAGDWEIVPGLGVAANGPVESVLVLADCAEDEIETVALDASSRTSAILVRLLLGERRWEVRPPAELEGAIGGRRAALVIGDAAMTARPRRTTIDLAARWRDETGLPFVFAVWAARPGTLDAAACARLLAAAETGARSIDAIASASPFGVERARRYLGERIVTRLGRAEWAGAEEFLRRAADAGLLPRATLRFAGEAAPRVALPSLLDRAAAGERLSAAQLLTIHDGAELPALGAAADARRTAFHPEPRVTYIVERNINYTNVCTTACRFCAFYRPVGHVEGYVLEREILRRKMAEVRDAGGIQILLQGGLNPELPIEWYEDLFRWMRQEFPELSLHALSPEEILHLTRISGESIEGVLERLRRAGLASVPGGGAEILVDRVRRRIAALKCTSGDWLEVMRVAHRLGMRSSATMMYAIGETARDRVEHLLKIRDLQDETGGFTAFICWPFQPGNTKLAGDDEVASAPAYLRQLAVARLALDNVRNLQASWPTMGPAVGQVALAYGANDFGSVMFEENVVSSAGTIFAMDAATIERHIAAAGYHPARRNMRYEVLTS